MIRYERNRRLARHREVAFMRDRYRAQRLAAELQLLTEISRAKAEQSARAHEAELCHLRDLCVDLRTEHAPVLQPGEIDPERLQRAIVASSDDADREHTRIRNLHHAANLSDQLHALLNVERAPDPYQALDVAIAFARSATALDLEDRNGADRDLAELKIVLKRIRRASQWGDPRSGRSRPVAQAMWLAAAAAWVLPSADRVRYAEEWYAELADIASTSRVGQFRYCLSILRCSVRLRIALQYGGVNARVNTSIDWLVVSEARTCKLIAATAFALFGYVFAHGGLMAVIGNGEGLALLVGGLYGTARVIRRLRRLDDGKAPPTDP